MPVTVEGHAWRHAIETGALLTAGTWMLGAFSAGHHVPLLWVLAALGCAATGACLSALIVTSSTQVAGYLAGWAVLTGGWLTFAHFTSPWTAGAVVALAGPAVILAPLGAVVFTRHASGAAAARAAAAAAAAAADLGKWADLLDAAGFADVRAVKVTANSAGKIVEYRLPSTGKVTFARLAQGEVSDGLRVALSLPAGGTVRFEAGATARQVFLHIIDRDVLAADVPFPADLGELTVTRPLPVGVRENGDVAKILYREVAGLAVGIRGSGKTNLLNVIVAQLARCVDTLIFVIDLKGGRFAAPWVLPWINGDCPRPAVDWIATDRVEAELMLTAVLAAIRARAASLSGGEKHTPTPQQPAIILVVDELAEIFGITTGPRASDGVTTNSALSRLGVSITNLGRSEAIDPLWCTLRGTVTTMPSDLKAQCGLRFALGVATVAEAQTVIPDNYVAAKAVRALHHAGSGLIAEKRQPATPVKFYRLPPSQVEHIAEVTGHYRPGPDQVIEDAMGEAYAQRWTRAAPLIDKWSGRKGPAYVDDQFSRIVADIDPDAGPVHPARARMRDVVRGTSVGTTPDMIGTVLRRESIGVARETLQRWLTADADTGIIERTRRGLYRCPPPVGAPGDRAAGADGGGA